MKPKFNYLYFDIYSKRASFFYNNSEKIGSNFGLFLILIYILFSLILFIYNIVSTLQRKDLRVYDSTMNTQELLTIDINSKNLYFAFGMENPISLNRFIDETIYYPEIIFIDKIKVNGEFIINNTKILEYEECKEEYFGENYQNLFLKGELKNSYCLKNFNYNLTLSGGFKYEKMSYIRIKVFPCVNSTENNNHCKSQEEIDYYLSSGYFSILLKNFGLNPTNYSIPVIPSLKDLYTTIGKRFFTSYILNFGITEIHTDKGLFNEKEYIEKYLQFREASQSFSLVDESSNNIGKDICLVQLKLDDTIYIQKRKYNKISEIFSKIGGYMQLTYTMFSLLCLLINKFDYELKIINSIFNFDIDDKKMALKYQSLRDFVSINNQSYNKNLIFSSRKSVKSDKKPNLNVKSSNNLALYSNSHISSIFKKSENKKKNDDFQSSKLSLNKSKNNSISQSPNIKIINFRQSKFSMNKKNGNPNNVNKENIPKLSLPLIHIENIEIIDNNNNLKKFNDKLSLNLFDYFFRKKNEKVEKHLELYNLGITFYKKRMDLIHVFTLLLITERILLKKNG